VNVGSVRASALALAAPDDNIPPGKGPEWGKAAPIGLLIILLLGLALFFLIKNMNKQFRKVPASFDPPAPESADGEGQAQTDPEAMTEQDPTGPGADEEVSGTPPDSAGANEVPGAPDELGPSAGTPSSASGSPGAGR